MGEILNGSNQYLTFRLGDETFALDITRVREVLDLINITKVPRTPEFMLGVINLRGNVVPVIDLRLSLGMPPSAATVDTCIIIVEAQMGAEQLLVGVLADAVQEVVEILNEDLSSPPRMGVSFNPEFIRSMGRRGEDFLIVLNMDRILMEKDIGEMAMMTSLIPQGVARMDTPANIDIQGSQP